MLSFVQASPVELVIRNSRFLAEAMPISSQEEARALLREQKARYSDSTHVVHAFILGPEANIMGCSDDGEPAGTAGRPCLEVLKGSGITNVMVTITRWFGGTKLGTGGLVKAYTASVQSLLAGAVTRELVATSQVLLSLPYAVYQQGQKVLAALSFEVESEEFAAEIQVRGRLRSADLPALQEQLRDLTRGQNPVVVLNGRGPDQDQPA